MYRLKYQDNRITSVFDINTRTWNYYMIFISEVCISLHWSRLLWWFNQPSRFHSGRLGDCHSPSPSLLTAPHRELWTSPTRQFNIHDQCNRHWSHAWINTNINHQLKQPPIIIEMIDFIANERCLNKQLPTNGKSNLLLDFSNRRDQA